MCLVGSDKRILDRQLNKCMYSVIFALKIDINALPYNVLYEKYIGYSVINYIHRLALNMCIASYVSHLRKFWLTRFPATSVLAIG